MILRPLHLAIALAFPAAALAQPDDTDLQAVRITAARAQGFVPNTVEAGTFRGADIMEVPSTVNVITREVLELQAAAGLYDALRNTAGVTRQQNGGETWDQLVIRGIAVENRTNYRLNGSLPVMNFSQVPMENKERVEVLKGATALYYGFTSPAGVVNFVTKRAGAKDITTTGLVVDDNGSAVASVDVGRRFGNVGVRVNAAGGTLGSHMDDVGNGNRAFVSAALDWTVSPRLRVKADVEYDRRRITEQAGIALPTAVTGVIALPHPVDPRRAVGPDWALFATESKNVQLRADYAVNDDWVLTVEGGHAETARTRRLAIFRLNNAAAVTTGAGRIAGNIQDLDVDSTMLRAELAGTVTTGPVRHDVTFGVARTDKGQAPIYQSNYTIAAQSLYDPTFMSGVKGITFSAMPTTPTTAALDSRDTGLYAIDRMALSDQWQLITAVRAVRLRSDQGANHYAVSKTTPMAALVWQPTRDVSLYASAAQGLEEGDTAPTGSANQGERLAPGVSRQREIGMRWRAPVGTLLQLALFDIDRPGYYTNAANVFTADGEQRYRGIEASAQGKLTPRLSWQASAQLIGPTFRDIGAAYDGKLPENASKRTASAFLSYDIAAVPGLSFNAGAYYTGRRPVNDLNQAFLGGTTLYSAGGRYATELLGQRTTWQLNVDNAADKRYWASAGTRLAAGLPRTVKLTVKVDW
ncbi:TonB-dependent siderophore receptor [Pseudoduganella plicata]|uniref:Ligand-gated channel n=1 Tax=Pseudoduganella plicata TaxID=321984 RepID=A0A4P7BAE6_9BURK|nr:TonB-dependent siderophore receptor [Pseudoduganella plicata]QBQ35394.1 TonB-dependent siderophore receptor [Pseudoduganella plicata]GGZ01381.1 ligand-gated channel [Pseudoduganella plicata]